MPRNLKTEPEWINRLLLIAALLAAVAVLAAVFRDGRHAHHAGTIADMTVNLNGRPVREHCTTCHPEGSRPGSGEAHPEIAPHSWTALGCTGCHLGEGMALDTVISHGLPGNGGRRVLAGKDLQASCFRCHPPAPLPGAEKVWRGFELFMANACDTCHNVTGLGQGGRYGPDLSGIGSTLGIDALVEAIRDPKKEPVNSIMPRFPLSAGQARTIAWFLKSRVRDPNYATPMAMQANWVRLPEVPMEIPQTLPPAGELLAARKCLACHRFGEEDGGLAPDLSWIGAMRPPEFLRAFLVAPNRLIPGAVMPRIPMTPAEEERLVGFLASAAGRVRSGNTGPDGGNSEHLSHPSADGAKHLYMALCQRCHAAAGDGFGRIQPNLANFPRAFAGNPDFFRRAPDERLRRSLEQGVPGTSMPPYGKLLPPAQREAVLDLLFAAFVGIPREEKIVPAPLSLPAEPFPGEMAVDRLYQAFCLRCHGQAGTGKGPEHLQHLPRPRNLTNHPYFAALPDERIALAIRDGVPGTAMPAFGDTLTPAQMRALAERVRRLSGGMDDR